MFQSEFLPSKSSSCLHTSFGLSQRKVLINVRSVNRSVHKVHVEKGQQERLHVDNFTPSGLHSILSSIFKGLQMCSVNAMDVFFFSKLYIFADQNKVCMGNAFL
uniref:Uncharacterized protein n=1 Tax=Sphaerodactylus townsendi TaxID=933632 RepID=A0ACB8EPM0_9SAUR